MSKLSLMVLGSFEALLEGRSLRRFRTKSVQALLMYLASERQDAQRREHLMALLWPGLPQTSAQANLRQTLYLLRQAIPEVDGGSEGEAVPFLLADRASIQVNPDAGFELDAARFESLLAGPLEGWPAAVDLYRGDFLAGFYLPDSAPFEEWVLARRETYRRRVLDALERLAEDALDTGELETAERYARRQVEIDDLRESGHRQLMSALALAGKRTDALAQYSTLRQLLDKELAAEPSAGIIALYESILTGETTAGTEPKTTAKPAPTDPTPLDLASSFPLSGPALARPLFVGRERQIAWLDAHLKRLLDSHSAGNIVFVAGEAGMGKTSLMQAFSDRATAENLDLLVAWGACNAFIGPGDAYLPFRQALDQLSGDVEGAWRTGTISTEQARRLWAAYPAFGQAVVERGRVAATTLVDGRRLLNRSRNLFPQGAPWLTRLEQMVELADSSPADLSQDKLHQAVLDLIITMVSSQPLLLLLDDLQWADSASLNLLFNLARGLSSSRILIVGAYRPEDVALGRDDGKHPLEKVVAEIRRLSGDVVLDLAVAQSGEHRAFVDALLDSEANLLDERFRRALFAHTGGQPLFTVEMLRYLQDRGDLLQNDDGAWLVGPGLAWNALPDRAEGVIEARIGRLEDELRELLNVAAVEGENFTAQVLARVQAVEERRLLHTLSIQLEKRHQLIRERSALEHGRRTLHRYRFSHALFQQYLYNDLSLGERQMLHAEIAAVLEELYAGRTDEIAVLLAGHYRAAGQDDRALPFLLHSGDRARDLYALEQAARHYDEALEILRTQGDYGNVYQILMKLGQSYHSAFEYDLASEIYREAFEYSEMGGRDRPTGTLASTFTTMRFGMPDIAPDTLDHTLTKNFSNNAYINHLFSGLLQLSPELDILPDIAARWQITDGGLTYTIHLRDDVVWSDGQPITALDFEYAWRRILDPRRSSPMAVLLSDISGATGPLAGESDRLGIEVVGDWTLQIRLRRPIGYFLHLLAIAGKPLPRHAIEAHGDNWSDPANIVTNGPFLLAKWPEMWRSGEWVVLRRNPAYHGPFPGNLEQVEIQLFHETAPVFEAYEKDELDFCGLGVRHSIQEYRQALQLYPEEIHSFPLAITEFIRFDANHSPFDDARVRRAFALAIDRLAPVDERLAFADGGLIPPDLPGHMPGIALPYDLSAARRLMATAGYPAGRGFPVVTAVIAEDDRDTVEYYDRFWSDGLGVKIQWDLVDRVSADQGHHLAFVGWVADYPDPDNFLRVAMSQLSNWTSESYSELLLQARGSLDQQERMQLYHQAEKILVDEAPIIPLYYGKIEWLIKPWVRNWRPLEFGLLPTHHVIVEPH